MSSYLSRHNRTPDYTADADRREPRPPVRQKERDQFIMLTGRVTDLKPVERIAAALMAAREPDAKLMLDMLGLTEPMLRNDIAEVFHPEEKSA